MKIVVSLLFALLASAGVARAAEPDRVVAYTIVNAREIPDSLTGAAGDPERGRQLYFNREVTGCSGCHGSPGGPGAQLNSAEEVAPSLSGIASRRTIGRLRLWLVAPEVIRPETGMPSYYAIGQRQNPEDPRFGETRLTAAEIEDLLAYLMRQTDP
ncbi:MAG: cytochrome c [Pseudomonadota bacterium]